MIDDGWAAASAASDEAGPADLVARAAASPGSPAMIAALAGVDPAVLAPGAWVDLLRAWERQISWVRAAQLPVLAAIASPLGPSAADSGPAADADDAAASGADTDTAATAGAAADSGQPILAGAPVVSDPVVDGPAGAARWGWARLARVGWAPQEGERSVDKVRCFVEATEVLSDAALPGVLAADPAAAQVRAEDAAARQRVTMAPLADGMAGLWAELPAAVATVMAGLTAEATELAAQLGLAGVPADHLPGIDHRRVQALLGWSEAALAAQDLRLTDARTAGRVAPSRRGGGAGRPRRGCRGGVITGRRAAVSVTVAATTLLGRDYDPAELAGYGPIIADTGRRLAVDGTWRWLLTDPRSGVLLDYGRTVYEPPADLRDFVRARDPVCVFPGCQRQSGGCDLDHVRAWHAGGATSADNVDPKCARHHTAKHEAGWQVSRSPDGTVVWTSPAGKTYEVPPCAIGPAIGPGTGAGAEEGVGRVSSTWGDARARAAAIGQLPSERKRPGTGTTP